MLCVLCAESTEFDRHCSILHTQRHCDHALHYHVFGSLLPCILVAGFSTRVQYVASVMSMGLLTGKTLVEYFWYILCALLLVVSFAITDGGE